MKRLRPRPRTATALQQGLLASVLSLLLAVPVAAAGSITLHLGPPGVGSGGANPVSIPPTNILEYELEYITNNDFETCLGISPGIFFGKRTRVSSGGAYVGLGGGAVIDTNGAGPGIYSSLGFNSSGKVIQFNAEVKQAIGIDFSHHILISPYAVRIGATFIL